MSECGESVEHFTLPLSCFSFLVGKNNVNFCHEFLESTSDDLKDIKDVDLALDHEGRNKKSLLEYYLHLALGAYKMLQSSHEYNQTEIKEEDKLDREKESNMDQIVFLLFEKLSNLIEPLWTDEISLLEWISYTVMLQNITEIVDEMEWKEEEDIEIMKHVNKMINNNLTNINYNPLSYFSESFSFSLEQIIDFVNSVERIRKKIVAGVDFFNELTTESSLSLNNNAINQYPQFTLAGNKMNVVFSNLQQHMQKLCSSLVSNYIITNRSSRENDR